MGVTKGSLIHKTTTSIPRFEVFLYLTFSLPFSLAPSADIILVKTIFKYINNKCYQFSASSLPSHNNLISFSTAISHPHPHLPPQAAAVSNTKHITASPLRYDLTEQ